MAIDSIGKVEVLETLGAGAHSSILQVRRQDDGKLYALKVVPIDGDEDKKYLEQARHEYRVGAMFDHPSLVKIHCLETESNWLFRIKKAKLLIEYVPGKTLDKAKLIRIPRMLRVFEKIASGLVHMHKHGVIHADLKPGNIMLAPNLTVKILDFGLARIKTDKPKDRVQGTLEYMAPETGSHKIVNERTDIYNFGVTMYRLATFELPPRAVPDPGGLPLTRKIVEQALKPVGELNPSAPKKLCQLIEDCLQYKAHDRPSRMSEVQSILDRLADKHPMEAEDME